MNILVMNAGSSSQKSCLYQLPADSLPDHPPEPLWEGTIDWTHQPGVAEVKLKTQAGVQQSLALAFEQRLPVMEQLLTSLWQGETAVVPQPQAIDAVGHRVVHGGRAYDHSIQITPVVKTTIAELVELAPVHNPANLEGIEAIEKILGAEVPQVAVFDTAFHAQMPETARLYPIPYEWSEKGLQRYGFHGTSHRYCAERTAELLQRSLSELKLITCHLGNGASLAAIRDGRSIDTTMGFTPLDGLMMGTRSGSVDPSILIHLMRHSGYEADSLDRLLNRESGLLGVSGVSNDLRRVTAAAADQPRAQLAIDLYIHRLRSSLGAMMASLGGVDAIVFTAGVGENAPAIRAAACASFEFLGLTLDPEKNAVRGSDAVISTPDSTVQVLVIHTQEDWMIARDCWQILSPFSQQSPANG